MTIVTASHLFLWTQWMYISLGVMIYRNNIPDITVLENVTAGTIVLPNIRTHLGLSHNTAVKLGPGSLNQFFRLDSESGQLICTNTVDLESPALCRFEKSCCRLEGNGQQTEHTSDKLMPSSYLEQNSSDLRRQFDPDGRTCRLMAFILASAATDTQLAPVTRLHVTIVDLNDNAPTFNPDSVTDTKTLSLNHLQNHPFVQIAFLEGSGGLHGSQDLPMAFDADFSLANRVARYWLEWDKSKMSNEGSLEGRSASIQLNSVLSTVGQDGLTWAVLGPFRLTYLSHGRSIALELDSELDREAVSQYHILLVAEDGGGLQGRLHITVDVIDVNEFAPVFVESFPLPNKIMKSSDQEVYHKHYKVPESLPVGSEIGRLQATDDDKSPENIITYRLGPGTPQSKITKTFHLNPTTGSLTLLQSLDHETTRSYRLTVIAQDGTTVDVATSKQSKEQQSHLAGRLSATAIVEISVTDVNDNAPTIRFEKSDQINRLSRPTGAQRFSTPFNHDVWIKENLIKGSPVTFFSVSDNDSGENSRVSCTLMNWTDRFQLREFAGLHGLETVGEFDRETTDTYYLTVRCQDHGTPTQQTDAVITVHIEDVNDLPPTFDLPLYQFHVLENSPVGTRLLPLNSNYPSTVSAKDPDLNTTLHYRLEPSDPESTVRGVSIKVADGSQGMDHHLFHIDPTTAVLTTHGELDRETRARLTFQVCADDGKHAAFTDVVVLLDDVNDNRPSFDRDTYVLRVEENHLSNSPLVVFKVTDADVDNQGFVFEFVEEIQPVPTVTRPADDGANQSDVSMYKNQPEPGTVRYHFALRDNTLYLRRSLDRELRSSYHFFIKVTDIQESKQVKDLGNAGISVGDSSHRLTSQAEIFVDVGDVNDNAPVLAFPNSTGPLGNRLSVSCHETMGSSVGRLQASDADLGPNATVVFSVIHTPEVDQLFYLDGQSGELFVNTGQLVARCGSSVILIISVDDQGPAESKRSRTAPVERLIIQLESKPTLAELIAAESRNKIGQLSNAAAGSALHNDEGVDSASVYGVLSTRTVLSVVLGGSTVFLIALLLVWIILLLYSRSRRQKRFRNLRTAQGKEKYETVTITSATQQQRSPEKVYLGPPQLVNQSTDDRGPYVERTTTWNTFKNEKQRDVTTLQQASTSIDLEHRGCSGGRINPDYAQSRTGTYSQFSKPDFPTATVRSRSSPTITATTTFPLETQSDYMTAVWHLDGAENYQTCSLEYANQPEACLRSPKKTGENVAAPFLVKRRRVRSSKFRTVLTNWIFDNILQRPRTKASDSLTAIPNSLAEPRQIIYRTQTPVQTRNYSPQCEPSFSNAGTVGRSVTCLRSSSAAASRPGSAQLVYATLRRPNIKPVTYVPVTLNNQGAAVSHRFTTHTLPFLTPPAAKRCIQSSKENQLDRSESPTKRSFAKNEYTSLLSNAMCSTSHCHAKSSPSVPSHPCASLRTFIPNQSQYHDARNNLDGAVPESTSSDFCPKEMVYPCCCPSCEPLLATWTNYEGISIGHSGSDSTRTCPQCHALDVPVSHGSLCCNANCAKSPLPMPDGRTDDQPHTETDFGRQLNGQCSTNYMSVQDILNSCV